MLLSKTLRAVIICLLFNIASFANNIIIVESQSYHPLHIMDQEWLNMANYHGDTGTIHPQSILSDANALAQADALIVSSAVILLDDNKINNILTFIQNGGNVYLQSEFTMSLAGNVAFQQIATDLGVTFNWENEFPGYVNPIVLASSLTNQSPSDVTFDYFFYAGSGSGDENVEVIADYLGDGVGFSIQSPVAGQGKIVTLSDQDWIRQQLNFDALDYIYQFINTVPFVAPELEIQATNMATCPGDIVNFTAMVDDIPTPYTLQWFINDIILPGVTSVSFSTAPTPGDIITCEITFQKPTGETCVVESNEIIIPPFDVPSVPNLTMTVNTTDLCGSETAFFNSTLDNNTDLSNFSYTWIINGQVASITPAMAASIGNFQDGQVVTCKLTYDTPCNSGLVVVSNPITMNVTTPVSPTIEITGNTTICSGDLIELNASGVHWGTNPTFEWLVDGVSSGQTGTTFSANNLTNGQIVTCEVISSIDCYTVNTAVSNSAIINETNTLNPTISISASPEDCPGEIITYTVSGNEWSDNAVTEWFIDGVATGNNAPQLSSNNFSAGQTISCELSNLSACSAVTSLGSNVLTVSFAPTITPLVEVMATPTGCPGEEITFTATGMNWDPNAQMQWYMDGVAVGNNTDELTGTNFNAGQIINFELSNLSSCYSSSSVISVGAIVAFLPTITPSISIAASPMVCPGELITYTASGNNWDSNAQLEWFIDGVATGNNTTEFAASNFVDGQIISCELSNLSSCYSVSSLISNDLTVEFLPTTFPTIEISTGAPVCPGETITYNAIGTDWDNNSQLEWFIDGITTGNTSDEFSSNNLVAGQEVTCVLSNLSGCSNTTSLVSNNITVSFAPTIYPTIEITTTNTSICENEMATLTATGMDWGINYQLTWFVDGQMVVSGTTDLELNINSENQTVTAHIISDLDCADGTAVVSNPISFQFIEPSEPIVTVGVDAFNCITNDYIIKADGINLGTNPSYEWFVDDISITNNGNLLTTNLQPGQTVSVTIQTENECTAATANSNLLVIEINELITSIAEQGDALCDGGNGFARLETTGGQAPYSYMWSDNNTNEFRTAIEAGIYQVIITDVNGCEDKIEVEIGEQVGPQIQDIEVNDVNCTEIYGSAAVFIESENDVIINWKNEDDQILSTEPIVSNLIVGKYHVEISDANGCFDTKEFEVQKMTAPDIVINDHIEVITGESTELQPQFSHGQNGMSFEWSPAIGLSCTDCENPIATPFSTTTYTLSVTTADGCQNSTKVTIYVAESNNVYVPNIFSPNSDGVNDYLLVYGGQEIQQINSMMVFNRNGETIFSKKDIQPNDEQEGWDGTFKGKKVQSGVYIYFTEVEFIDGRIEMFKGDVFVTE